MKLPMHFNVSAHSTSGIQTSITAKADDLPEIIGAIPPEFNGPGGGYSPEDIYALALLTCYLATFKVYAEKAGFPFKEIRGKTTLIIDRNPQGLVGIQTLEVSIELIGAQDSQKAEQLFKEAERFCLVSNALKVTKNFSYSILSE